MTVLSVARKASKAVVAPLGMPARRRQGDVVVLLYHRVGEGRSEIELPADIFEHQLVELGATQHVLTLDEALDNEHAGGVVVTFDDGYRDFHDVVLPLLVKHRIPAHLYLATGLVADGTTPPEADALTWPQLRAAVGTGLVSVGSHTDSHINLSRATEVEAEDEMRRSKELIED